MQILIERPRPDDTDAILALLAILQLARGLRTPHAYLLTTTAERYFPKFGFERIERHDVPASVQASTEFRSACPASAVVMRKPL